MNNIHILQTHIIFIKLYIRLKYGLISCVHIKEGKKQHMFLAKDLYSSYID